MKILILANNQENINAIKANIKYIDSYCAGYEIGDLPSHEITEINDVINCNFAPTYVGGRTIKWDTDDESHKVDEKKYDIVIVYKRFLEDQVQDINWGNDLDDDAQEPAGYVFTPTIEPFYGI